MIPNLKHHCDLESVYKSFVKQLKATSYAGDISVDYASRVALATDNSVYQVLPQAILNPKNANDIAIICKLAHKDAFRKIVLTPRGGGTGTNGQALTDGIVVDTSKHMNNILEINAEECWVRVETGVIKDQLNAALKPHGLFFAPELSTSNRATIGGMINTDASGQGSCTYGKTRDHVLELHTVLMDGSPLTSYSVNNDALAALSNTQDRAGEIHRVVNNIYNEHKALILDTFPPLNRCMTGYDLAHIREDSGNFNLNNILCGSEGTLGFITEAKLNLLPIPKHSGLVIVKYADFNTSLRDATELMKAEPTSIETIDSKVLNLAMNDVIWQQVETFFDSANTTTLKGINLVEYTADSENELIDKIEKLVHHLKADLASGESARIGYAVAWGQEQVNKLWAMRKRAVGLLGNAKGEARPVPFVEDTAVPPENLADFILEFREILDGYELEYGMFGHVDAGVLHVRPSLDMKDPRQEAIAWEISDRVAELCHQYHGVLWGEHGKGVRSEYAPKFFGELYPQLQRIKNVFDPYNQLNPGKIATPNDSIELLKIDEVPTRGQQDRNIHVETWQAFDEAVYCNGNGACFNWTESDVMCPSWKGTRDRIHSPKGRASLIRDWLKLLSAKRSFPTEELEKISFWRSVVDFPRKLFHTTAKLFGRYDYSHEVYRSMAGCLSCKACASQCPIKVDVPEFRARFLALYHTRYLRPLKDYLVATLEFVLPLCAKVPHIYNVLMTFSPIKFLLKHAVGFVNGPLLTGKPLVGYTLGGETLKVATKYALKRLSEEEKSKTVVIVQDAFTSYFETQLVLDTARFLQYLGYTPLLAPYKPNGKPLHIHGFLKAFKNVAQTNATLLNTIASSGVSLIGIDPSMTYTYRAEYKKFLGEINVPPVMLMQEWLEQKTDRLEQIGRGLTKNEFFLLPHCIETSHAAHTLKSWQSIYKHMGQTLTVLNVGCCGMSGTYGHEKRNEETSKRIYELSWKQPVQEHATESLVATGYSCRSQVKREDGKLVGHPVQTLLKLVEQQTK